MAKIENLFNSGQGGLGNLVFYQMNGKNIVRTKPKRYSDRKSSAQLAQRQRLQVMNGFLNPFRELIRVTFAAEAVGRTALQTAQSYNMQTAFTGEYPHIAVDKSKALLSNGPLPLPKNATVKIHPEGLLINWENEAETKPAAFSDILTVVALFEENKGTYNFTETLRSEGKYLWKLSKPVNEDALPDVWIAFRNRTMTQWSASLYLNG